MVRMQGGPGGAVGDEMQRRQKPDHSCFPPADLYGMCIMCQAARCARYWFSPTSQALPPQSPLLAPLCLYYRAPGHSSRSFSLPHLHFLLSHLFRSRGCKYHLYPNGSQSDFSTLTSPQRSNCLLILPLGF